MVSGHGNAGGFALGLMGRQGGGGWKIKEMSGEICIVLTENV